MAMPLAGDFQSFTPAAAKTGLIVEWNAARGFGYLECEGKRVFLHIKEFEKRPGWLTVGDEVGFVAGQDLKGRPCAKSAVAVKRKGRPGSFSGAHFVGLLLLLALPVLALMISGLPPVLLGVYPAGISLLTFWLYFDDKRRAQSGGWRTPESTLHLCELLGGWPAAFIAQRVFRHKSAKGRYLFVFWAIVILHQIVAADFISGGMISGEVLSVLRATGN
jgi:uncharacterized membrane protein YsdA (DUF1294 family)/cold shock CspA family protein